MTEEASEGLVRSGEWHTPRGDVDNHARSALAGAITTAPRERWSIPTGADVRFARTIDLDPPSLFAQAGSTLQMVAWDGRRLWERTTLGVRSVIAAGILSHDGPPAALVVLDDRTLATIDLRSGEVTWTWTSPPSSSIAEPGSWKLFRSRDGAPRIVCFPTYATTGTCFDLSDPLQPSLLWEVDHGDTYDAGFGPHVIVRERLGGDHPELIISSRSGTSYAIDESEQRTTGAQVVLGRDHGRLYQAVVDSTTGCVVNEVRYEPEPGGYPCARPYGLLQVVETDQGPPDIVLVSCQVEEYLAVTTYGQSGLQRRWGRFVEKDWPEDHFELRPQITSVARLRDDGPPELVFGLWDGVWSTVVVDIAEGPDGGTRAQLDGYYFWACADVDGDGHLEIVVTEEQHRTPARRSRVCLLDGRTLRVKAQLDDVALVTSSDSELPPHIGFRADRRSAIPLDGDLPGLLVENDQGIARWGPVSDGAMGLQAIAGPGWTRADLHQGELLLSDGLGRAVRFDADLRESGRIDGIRGRASQPLVWTRTGGSEVVFDRGDQSVAGGRHDPARSAFVTTWGVPGAFPVLHRDSAGVNRLTVAHSDDPHAPRLTIHEEPGRGSGGASVQVELPAPARVGIVPFGREFRALVSLGVGVHTAGLVVIAGDGRALWQDLQFGAHPQRPGVARLGNHLAVVVDDHGLLRVIDAEYGRTITETDWTAAYTLPMPLGEMLGTGEGAILRADGFHGIELLGMDGRRRWRRETELADLFGGASAVGRPGEGQVPVLGSVTRDGRFDATDLRDGERRWSLELGGMLPDRTVVAVDIDGDGSDEFLTGTRDGRLLCIAEDDQVRGVVKWAVDLPASVTAIVPADVDGDGHSEILVSTADGFIRLLVPAG